MSYRGTLLAKASLWVLPFYWLALVTATHIPMPDDGLPIDISDKLMHLIAYGILAALLACVLLNGRRVSWWGTGALVAGLSLHAAVDEVTQKLIPGRYASVADWLADMSGVILGLTVGYLLWRVLNSGANRAAIPGSS
ncbi:MAG: VanZ family protein [Pirellulaceae bacterium]|nr:VanZ family protein [Planctomycetales bacterium]